MAIKIGIAPDSWGVWFPASDPNNAKQPQWWRCLDEMKVAGYEGCEIGPWGYMPNDDPKVLKNAMDARGLTLVGATEGGNFLDDAAVEGMLKDIDDISKLLKAFPSEVYRSAASDVHQPRYRRAGDESGADRRGVVYLLQERAEVRGPLRSERLYRSVPPAC